VETAEGQSVHLETITTDKLASHAQKQRDTRAALRLMPRLLRNQHVEP
jgi:hypothetical protein